MPQKAILFGVLLIVLGLVGYLGTTSSSDDGEGAKTAAEAVDAAEEVATEAKDGEDSNSTAASVTSLIPAFVGILLALCGVLAMNESRRKHAMHGAATIALLGFIAGAGRGSMGIGKFLNDDPSLNQRSFLFVWLMAILCGVFVVMCIQSFRQARKEGAV